MPVTTVKAEGATSVDKCHIQPEHRLVAQAMQTPLESVFQTDWDTVRLMAKVFSAERELEATGQVQGGTK